MRAESIGFAQRTGIAAARRDLREDDRRILEASARYRARLAHFIRRRWPDPRAAAKIPLRDFLEPLAAYRLLHPRAAAASRRPRTGPPPTTRPSPTNKTAP